MWYVAYDYHLTIIHIGFGLINIRNVVVVVVAAVIVIVVFIIGQQRIYRFRNVCFRLFSYHNRSIFYWFENHYLHVYIFTCPIINSNIFEK